MKVRFGQLQFTATHFLENLAGDLYDNPGDCAQELVRNGLCACMPQGKWAPKLGHVEIWLVDNHPLAPKTKSLVILDHGGGITQPNMELYCTVGRAIGDRGDGHSGAAQKRIGRFSAFALNERCMNDRDITTGFYILTRTSASGMVTMVPMIPERLERDKGEIHGETISPDATELGPQRRITGSFTAIVVPNSVFKSYDEIRDALKWRMPRKSELVYRLEINGKRLTAPPLHSQVSIAQDNGPMEAYLDRLHDRDDPNGGIWLTDADTGLRVASARVLGQQRLPYPLWKPDLVGDIFLPGLLSNQGTSRTSLSARYLSSAAWKKATMFLIRDVVPAAKSLLGDDDVFGRDSASRSLLSLVEKCNQIWGRPSQTNGGTGMFDDLPGVRRTNASGSNANKPGNPGSRGANVNPRQQKPRAIPIRIGETVFILNKRPMDARVYAEVDSLNGSVIYINDQEYKAMPRTREARDEHVLLKVLEAAAQAKFEDPNEIKYFVAERRIEIMK